MQINKTFWGRKLISLFCAILIFSTFMMPTAFADDVHIATAYQEIMYCISVLGDKEQMLEQQLTKAEVASMEIQLEVITAVVKVKNG